MNQERLMQVIQGPVISEKGNNLSEAQNQITLKVLKNATKHEIKDSVELLLGVSVVSVNTVTIKGKQKRLGRFVGRRSDVKKAYVTLAEGQNLDLEATAAKTAE